jgi:putative hydrolase of the HAD superfamily
MNRPAPPRAVTFDCWGTLIYETHRESGEVARAQLLERSLREQGIQATYEAAKAALGQAWGKHWQQWRVGVVADAVDMAGWALGEFGIQDPALVERFGRELEEVSLTQEIVALDGARETLEALSQRGIRRALICDTGFSPGRVVRRLLDRAKLLELLEVLIFSDEAGAPKPNPRLFHTALEQLDVEPQHALHVGDLRRSDVAGARAAGMGSVRIRWQHDDPSELPDADTVADSHAHLREILGLNSDGDVPA